jgi:hypothetical protein
MFPSVGERGCFRSNEAVCSVGAARAPEEELMISSRILALFAVLLAATVARAQEQGYTVHRTDASRAALLSADAEAWSAAHIIEWGPSRYSTTFRALWDDAGLHLLWEVADPSPWHTMTERDDRIWEEEVVEVFLDLDGSGRHYYELEVSPAGVVCDVDMITASPWQGDLAWNLEGLEARAHPRTDAKGTTTGWAVTAFLPWSGFRPLPSARAVSLPPEPRDAWRFNAFRIERPGGPQSPKKDAVFAAWSPPSGSTFHEPAAFRPFRFEAR